MGIPQQTCRLRFSRKTPSFCQHCPHLKLDSHRSIGNNTHELIVLPASGRFYEATLGSAAEPLAQWPTLARCGATFAPKAAKDAPPASRIFLGRCGRAF